MRRVLGAIFGAIFAISALNVYAETETTKLPEPISWLFYAKCGVETHKVSFGVSPDFNLSDVLNKNSPIIIFDEALGLDFSVSFGSSHEFKTNVLGKPATFQMIWYENLPYFTFESIECSGKLSARAASAPQDRTVVGTKG